MNRSYNFQADNGLFVVEYLLEKDYKDITIEDLKENVGMISDLMVDRNEAMGTLSRLTHNNSFIANNSVACTKDVVEHKLMQLLEAVGEDRECIICGEKRVDAFAKLYATDKKGKVKETNIPYGAIMYGVPSLDKFANHANNLQTIDICGVCLFLSMVSFLNTQKISYPFVYLSDSDEFMRETTQVLQEKGSKGEMYMESGGKKDENEGILQRHFLEEILGRHIALDEKDSFEGLNYIEMYSFQNAKDNHYNVDKMGKDMVHFLGELKKEGMIQEFTGLGLFLAARKGRNLYTHFARQVIYEMVEADKRKKQKDEGKKTKKKEVEIELRYANISEKLLQRIRGVSMKKQELEMVEKAVSNLMDVQGVEKLKTEIRGVKSKQEFKDFLLQYNEEIPLFEDIESFDKVVEQHFVYKDLMLAEMQIRAHREGKTNTLNAEGEK